MRPGSRHTTPIAALAALIVSAAVLFTASPASAQSATFSMAPTSGPVGTVVSFESVTPCSNGEDEVVLSNVANPGDADIIASAPVALRIGSWSLQYTIPAATPPGDLTFYAYCAYTALAGLAEGAAAPAATLGMAYDPQTFTVTEPTTTLPSTTTTVVETWMDLDKGTYQQGQQMWMTGGGWMPGTDVHMVVFSDPVDLGFAVADQLGDLSHAWTIPADFAVGVHTVTLTGLDLAGNLVTLSQQFDVTALAGSLSNLASTTTAAVVTAVTTLPTTGITPQTAPLTVLGLLLALGGAGLVAFERKRRAVAVGAPTSERGSGPPDPRRN